MTQLVRFRTAFCANAQEQGLTDRDAEQRWEKIVQAIYSRLSRGPVQGTAKVSMVLSKGIPKDLTEDRAISFAREELGETFSLDQPTLSTHHHLFFSTIMIKYTLTILLSNRPYNPPLTPL